MTKAFSRLRHETNIFSDTLLPPAYAIASKTFVSFSTAFTLAEVLIVLGIIGLIADMTIPTLHQSITEKTLSVQLKKAHSTFENAFRMAVSENGSPETWNLIADQSPEGSMNMMNAMLPYLRTMQVCGLDKNLKCFADVTYKNLNGTNALNPNSTTYARIRLADGTSAFFAIHSPTCTLTANGQCGVIIVDVNGEKPPNTIGKDYFRFQITKNGIIPTGTQKDDSTPFEDRCVKKGADGWGCAAWVIYNENMDYLHCTDLSWDGSHYCK